MQTVEHLRHLYSYNDWANRRLIVALKNLNAADAPLKLLAHVLTTEQEYYGRFYGKDSTGFNFWPELTLEDCGALCRENAANFEKLLRRFDDEGLDLYVKYRTSTGQAKENSFRELLTHILFHSATHRGNIIVKIREAGGEPPPIDYVVYLRETVYI